MADLYKRLSNIGFYLNGPSSGLDELDCDIEETIILSLYELDSDSRLFSLVFSWGKIHGKHLIADKFFNTYEKIKSIKGECPWVSGFCSMMISQGDRRFKKGITKFRRPVFLRNKNVEKLIEIKGAIEWLEKVNIRVPSHYFEFHERKIMPPEKLIKKNRQYRNRFIYGTNWRSEVITLIELGFENPYQISKHLGIGYPRVREVFKDYSLANSI